MLHGDVYDGEWKAGNKEGRGVYKYASGDVYDGEWKAELKKAEEFLNLLQVIAL